MDHHIKISASKIEKLESLVELAQILSQQNDFNEILRLVTQLSARLLKAEVALILMVNPRTQNTVKTLFHEDQSSNTRKYKVAQNLISGWVMKNQKSLLSMNIREDERFSNVKLPDKIPTSVMCVPLRFEGIVLGTILLLKHEQGKEFDANDLNYLEKIAVISAPYLCNVQSIQEYFEPPLHSDALLSKYRDMGLLGKSKRFVELLQAIESCARCDVRVVLEGESGTGKELIARAIHRFSNRHSKPFLAIDCGAIPDHLIESELFGHKKGAFTGATFDRNGIIETTDGGTLFIDEIANLPIEMQTKFMRFLQEGEIRPVGANVAKTVNVRVISASSQSLLKLVEKGKFREDLYFRVHVYPIHVPSLRERAEDIELLCNEFLQRFSKQQHKQIKSFHVDILQYMQGKLWKGNIRELENFVERLVTVAPSSCEIFFPQFLPHDLQKEVAKISKENALFVPHKSLTDAVVELEERMIRKALIESEWNQSQAARTLNLSEHTLRYKMKKRNIAKPS
jgi:Nif-specific regulatory protein